MVDSASGAPKYLEGSPPSEKPNILILFLLVIFGVLKKYKWDFSLFISSPLDFKKVSSPFFMLARRTICPTASRIVTVEKLENL